MNPSVIVATDHTAPMALCDDWSRMSDDEAADAVMNDAAVRERRGDEVEFSRYANLIPSLGRRRVVLDAVIETVVANAVARGEDEFEAASRLSREHPEIAEAVADTIYFNRALGTTAQCHTVVRGAIPPTPFGVGEAIASGVPRYLAISPIGEGTSGVVFEGVDRRLSSTDRPARVAIKVLMRATRQPTETIVAEATRSRRIEHQNVVRLLDADTTPWGSAFTVTELVDGTEIVGNAERKNWKHQREIVRQIIGAANGVAAAHAAGVIHLDIKPSNVLVTRDGAAKVADFGLARVISHEASQAELDGFIGSIGFAPPEHMQGVASTSSDVYGLGGLLFYCLTGAAPNGDDPEQARRWLNEQPAETDAVSRRRAALRRVGVRGDLVDICIKALRWDRGGRHATVVALAADLQAVLEHRTPPSLPAGSFKRAAKWARRNPWLAAGACMALAATLWAAETWSRSIRVESEAARQQAAANAASDVLEVLKRGKGGSLETDGLQVLWIMDSIYSDSPLMDPAAWASAARKSRIEVLQSAVESRQSLGKASDLETVLMRLSLALWVVLDKQEHGDEVARAEAVLADLRGILDPADELLEAATVIREAAHIKHLSYTSKRRGLQPHEMKRVHDCIQVIDRAERSLREQRPGSPIHRLAISALYRAYGSHLVNGVSERCELLTLLNRYAPDYFGDRTTTGHAPK